MSCPFKSKIDDQGAMRIEMTLPKDKKNKNRTAKSIYDLQLNTGRK